jgi:hypothetical protein
MLFFHIRLLDPDTKEVYYEVYGPKPELPPKDLLKKYQGALLVINTTGSSPELKKLPKAWS